MDQHVSLQVHVLHEALPTDLTQEASLLVVEADMSVQSLFLGEAFPTEAAGEGALPGVDLQVRLQITALVEGFPAEAAAVRFLSGVDPYVHLQRCVSREALPTDMARVADLTVGVQVSREASGGLVVVSAESAAAVRILQVSLHVFYQEGPLVEGVPAHFAVEGRRRAAVSLGLVDGVFLMSRHVSPQAARLGELLSADAAGMQLLAAVLPHVPLQRGHVTEGPAALFALERFLCGVDANVRRQVSLLAELFAADVAAVRFLSSVQTHMQLLRQDGLEGFSAKRAGFTLLLVRLQVSRQVICRVQMFAADTAAAVRVVGADLQDVFEQEALPLQRAPAHLTDETLSRSRALPFVPASERRPPSLVFPRRSRTSTLLGPVAVQIGVAANG